MSDTQDAVVEHGIRIESTQIWRGYVEPSHPEYLTGDGEWFDRLFNREKTNASFDLDFHSEKKITFECECGRRFRKPETAREHLEEVADER